MPDTPMSTDRPDLFYEPADRGFVVVPKYRGLWDRFWENGVSRKFVLLVVLALIWEGYGRWLDNSLLFPTFIDTVTALIHSTLTGLTTMWLVDPDSIDLDKARNELGRTIEHLLGV